MVEEENSPNARTVTLCSTSLPSPMRHRNPTLESCDLMNRLAGPYWAKSCALIVIAVTARTPNPLNPAFALMIHAAPSFVMASPQVSSYS